MAEVRQVQVTVDCADPRAVAEFWKAALGYVDPPTAPGFDSWDAFDETLGARRVRLLPADEEDEACLVMQDVEGNRFCLD
jgi:hypothetical protein